MGPEGVSHYGIAILNPKNKAEIQKVSPIFVSLFFPSFSNSFAAFTDKDNVNEWNGEETKENNWVWYLNPNIHNLRNQTKNQTTDNSIFWIPIIFITFITS